MEMIIDFALLAASGAAAFYCFILSRKLEGLKSTDKGLGATIATMSQTVDQARAAVMLAKESSAQSAAELSPLLHETREVIPKLAEMIDVISELAEIAIKDINEASTGTMQQIDVRLEHAHKLQIEMDERLYEINTALHPQKTKPNASPPPSSKHNNNVAYLDESDMEMSDAVSRLSEVLTSAKVKRNQKKAAR